MRISVDQEQAGVKLARQRPNDAEDSPDNDAARRQRRQSGRQGDMVGYRQQAAGVQEEQRRRGYAETDNCAAASRA